VPARHRARAETAIDRCRLDHFPTRRESRFRLAGQQQWPMSRGFYEGPRRVCSSEACQKASRDDAVRRAYRRCVRNVSARSTDRQQQSADLQALYRSPLTDSNRRPPPYHAIPTATAGSRWQRFGASSSDFSACCEVNLCHRLRPLCSIPVPSQSSENAHPTRQPPPLVPAAGQRARRVQSPVWRSPLRR
jgi:hypothetical protein